MHLKSGLNRQVVCFEGDNLVELCNLHVSKIWSDSDKRGGRWWEWPYKRGDYCIIKNSFMGCGWVMVFNATFNNISVISLASYNMKKTSFWQTNNLLLLSKYNKSLLNNTIFVFIYLSCNSWKTLGLLKTKNDIHFFHTWGMNTLLTITTYFSSITCTFWWKFLFASDHFTIYLI